MKKWYFFFIIIILMVVLANVKKRRKKKSGVIKRIDNLIDLLFWFLLIAYGFSFAYWLYQMLS